MIRRAFIAALALLVAAPALAEAPRFAPAPPARPAFAFPTGAELAAASGLSGDIAYLVVDLDAGAALEGANVGVPLPPASVAKVPTALYALDALGADHRFETRLIAVGPIEGGVLKGDLILQGGGDPEMDTGLMSALAQEAVRRGLRRVEGRFIVDDALLPTVERIDGTQPEVASYNPSVGALNLNYNRVHAEWRISGGGYEMRVEARSDGLSPPTRIARVEVVEETQSGRIFDYVPTPDGELWRVRRKALGARGARWLPVRRPSEYAADTFRRLAADAGLNLPAPEFGETPLIGEVIARAGSRPLSAIARGMLRYSTNLTAEALGLSASRARGVSVDSLAGSGGAMDVWAGDFAGFAAGDGEFRHLNHSGLAADSRATVRRLVALLAAADRRGFPGLAGGAPATLRALLPEKPYLDDDRPAPPHRATLRAKTGTLNFVSALAGYVDVEDGRRLAFAILTADMAARAAIADPKAESPRGSRSWARRSRALQWELIRSWIARFGKAG